jgi:hypothetical protein
VTDTVSAGTGADEAGRRDALAERLFQSLIASLDPGQDAASRR